MQESDRPIVVLLDGRGSVDTHQIPGGPTVLVVRPAATGWVWVVVLLAIIALIGVAAAIVIPTIQGHMPPWTDQKKEAWSDEWGKSAPESNMPAPGPSGAFESAPVSPRWEEARETASNMKTALQVYATRYGLSALKSKDPSSAKDWEELGFDDWGKYWSPSDFSLTVNIGPGGDVTGWSIQVETDKDAPGTWGRLTVTSDGVTMREGAAAGGE